MFHAHVSLLQMLGTESAWEVKFNIFIFHFSEYIDFSFYEYIQILGFCCFCLFVWVWVFFNMCDVFVCFLNKVVNPLARVTFHLC